ncbi:MAG TPA: ankyrin repeat domain-containing protein [Blastocatellia bacterium]
MAYVVGRIHTETVRASLESADLATDAPGSLGALLRAAMTGNTTAVSALIERGLNVNARDDHGRTPLLEAVFGGHSDTIEYLLSRGADPDLKDRDGWTALMEAASKSHVDAVRMLLGSGADPNARNNRGWTALRTTARGNAEIIRLLKQAGARR